MIRSTAFAALIILPALHLFAQQTAQTKKVKVDLHDTIVRAREEEDRLHRILVKIEGNKLFCNGPWMKTFTNEDFEKLISEFQKHFSQPENWEQDGIQYLTERLQSERTQLPGFKADITLDCRDTKLKTTVHDAEHELRKAHIIDGEFHLFTSSNRESVEISRNFYQYLSYSLKDFRIPTGPWLTTDRAKFQQYFLVQKLDDDRYEITYDTARQSPNQTSPPTRNFRLQYRFNIKTRLVEEFRMYMNDVLIERSLAVGQIAMKVQAQNPQERDLIWFPRYCVKMKYSQGKPFGVFAQRTRSVELDADTDLDVTVRAAEGTEVVLNYRGRRMSQGRIRKDIEDVLEVYAGRLK